MIAEGKIAIVTRDPALLELVRDHLGEITCQAVGTENGNRELSALLQEEPPDLVLLDIMMPWIDGIEAGLLIRQWCDVPVLMLSTWGAGKDRVRGLDLTADDYLTEPFGIAELMVRIGEALDRNRDSRDLLVAPADFCLN